MPKPFSGKAEDWDDFSFKFKAYMVMKNADYVTIFSGAEKSTGVITDQHFIIEGDLKEDLVKLSRELQYMLIHLCEGSSTNLLRQTENSHGAESWRRLHAHYMPSQAMSSMGRLASLIDFNFSTNSFENDFVLWESELQKYEKETSSTLPDSVKIAVLMNKTTGDIQRHVRLNASRLTRFADVRETILTYFKALRSFQEFVFNAIEFFKQHGR